VRNRSTSEVARLLRIGRQTLQRWIREKRDLAPRKTKVGGVTVRLWTETELEQIRQYKEENYCKGRGRKPKPKR